MVLGIAFLAFALVTRANCALTRLYPKGHELRVSHETIYNCIYAQPVGELRKELIATLRHAHNKRLPQQRTGSSWTDPRHAQHPRTSA